MQQSCDNATIMCATAAIMCATAAIMFATAAIMCATAAIMFATAAIMCATAAIIFGGDGGAIKVSGNQTNHALFLVPMESIFKQKTGGRYVVGLCCDTD